MLCVFSAPLRGVLCHKPVYQRPHGDSVKPLLRVLRVDLDAKVLNSPFRVGLASGVFQPFRLTLTFSLPFSIQRNCQTSGPFFRFLTVKFPY